MTLSPVRFRAFSALACVSFSALAALSSGCSSSPAAEAPPKAATSAPATQPDAEKVRAHLTEHVKYPATRAEVLAACAETPEFSPAEKAWFSDRLPEGSYASAEDVLRSLKL